MRPLTWIDQRRRWLLGAIAALVLTTTAISPANAQPSRIPATLVALSGGAVISLQGTSHLWVADAAGLLHWAGDTRSLAGQFVDWPNRREVSFSELSTMPRGDPWLSAKLLKVGDAIYFPKWESGQARPVLQHIVSIEDVAFMGINGANYGLMLLDQASWERQYGISVADLLETGPAPQPQPTPPAPAAGPSVLGMFVPCAALGSGYADTGSSNEVPGLYFYGCDSPYGPTVLQMILDTPSGAVANSYNQEMVADYLDPQSSSNRSQGLAPWFEIPASGPAGSRTFKRLGMAPNTNRQIDTRAVKGRYVATVTLTFHMNDDGRGEFTPARAGQILTTLLARVPG